MRIPLGRRLPSENEQGRGLSAALSYPDSTVLTVIETGFEPFPDFVQLLIHVAVGRAMAVKCGGNAPPRLRIYDEAFDEIVRRFPEVELAEFLIGRLSASCQPVINHRVARLLDSGANLDEVAVHITARGDLASYAVDVDLAVTDSRCFAMAENVGERVESRGHPRSEP